MSRETRVLDDTPVLLRHVRRPQGAETGSSVLVGTFVAAGGAELEALNGRSGWQSGEIQAALSGDGSITLRLPNAGGDDGILHRKRFAIFTDPLYRIGEEWIEVYREPMSAENLIGVMTPAGARVNRGSIELRGPDLMALYTLARSGELDVWHHAPRDVFEFYSRLPVAEWSESLNVIVDSATAVSRDLPAAGVAADAWSAAVRLDWLTPAPATAVTQTLALQVRLADGSAVSGFIRPFDQVAYIGDTAFDNPALSATVALVGKGNRTIPGDVSLKLVCRDRWISLWVAGELVATGQLDTAAAYQAPNRVTVIAGGTATGRLTRIDVESYRAFGLRGASKGDLKLPGLPTPGGLRGDWFNFAHHFAAYGTAPTTTYANYLHALFAPTDKPVTTRLDAVPVFTPGAPPPAGGAPAARWTGAIYLDLSGNGRRLRINTSTSLVGVRLWVGRTMRSTDALVNGWDGTAKLAQTSNLRDTLGEGSGWYPIVLEAATLNGVVFSLEESALDGAGNATGGWTAVPSSKLSPLGCYLETHRLESHRELLGAVADGFGYQWRAEPRTLESGEFPGQIIPRARVGVDTDKIVTADEATDLESEIDAMDAADRLSIDAAGIADPKGSGQLSADVYNDAAIDAGHLFLSTGAESMPEVTEPELLLQRAASLLALRASPNEQIGVRPTSQPNEVTDTFPLTGALARRRWRVGDGLRLALEDLSVIDATPRQIAALSLPIFRQGIGAPTVGFRQRPRGLRAFLYRTTRAAAAERRNWQGQLALVHGTMGQNPVTASLPDLYSRMTLPWDPADVVDCWLVVESYTAPAGTIEVNNVSTGITVNAIGRYPINRWLQRLGIEPTTRLFVRVVTATASYRLEAIVKLRA